MRLAWLALLLLPAAPAFADDVDQAGVDALPVDDPAPTARGLTGQLDPDLEALDAPPEGVWAWVKRLEGEVLTREAFEALEESAEIQYDEGALDADAGKPDIPVDVYQDPAAVLRTDPLLLSSIDPGEVYQLRDGVWRTRGAAPIPTPDYC